MGIFDGLLDAAVPYGGGLLQNHIKVQYDPEQFQRAIGLLGQIGSQLNRDPMQAIMGLLPQSPPATFNERFAPATANPLQAAPLPPPTNVGSLPQPPAQLQQPPAQEAAIPLNAQPTVNYGQPPEPLFPTRDNSGVGAGFRGVLANAHNGPIGALLGGVAGLAGMGQGSRQENIANALYQSLQSRYPPEQAKAIAMAAYSNPKLAEILLPQALGLNPPKNIEELIARGLYKNGQGANLGSGLAAIEELKRAESRGVNAGKTEGERTATAQIDLPATVAKAQEAMRLAESLRSHPGRDNPLFFHGKLSNYLPDASIPGNTDAFDANNRLFQLKSGAFAEAYASLKGGGQISNIEGAKMTESLNRMNRASSRKEFDAALSDFQGILRLGIDRAAQQAGRNAPYGFKGNQGHGTTASGIRWQAK